MVTRAAHQGGFFIGGSRRQPDPTHEPHWMLTHTPRCNSWHVPSAHPANAAPGRQSSNGGTSIMAEYTYNSAKRRQREQFSPERRQGPEGEKWQSSAQTLPLRIVMAPNSQFGDFGVSRPQIISLSRQSRRPTEHSDA